MRGRREVDAWGLTVETKCVVGDEMDGHAGTRRERGAGCVVVWGGVGVFISSHGEDHTRSNNACKVHAQHISLISTTSCPARPCAILLFNAQHSAPSHPENGFNSACTNHKFAISFTWSISALTGPSETASQCACKIVGDQRKCAHLNSLVPCPSPKCHDKHWACQRSGPSCPRGI